jgi:putative transposase
MDVEEPNGDSSRDPVCQESRPCEPRFPVRKHPAHGVLESADGPTIVFDTVCTKNRAQVLANEDVHAVFREAWTLADAWRVGRYVVMPDHVHYFAAGADPLIGFDAWVQYWKSQFSKLRRSRAPNRQLIEWQTDHWDVTIRSWQAYNEKWEYVCRNPVRHGLVTDHTEWPFQGEIHRLRWE